MKRILHILVIFISCGIPVAAGEYYRQLQEADVAVRAVAVEAPFEVRTPSEARVYSPTEGELEEGVEPEEPMNPGRLNLAFWGSDLEKTDSNDLLLSGSESVAARLYARLSDRDSVWASKLYDMYGYTPLQAAQYLGLTEEEVTAKAGIVAEFESINAVYYDGQGRTVERLSNSRTIVAMCNVLYTYGVLNTEEELTAYADALWEASHHFQAAVGKIYYCDGSCMEEDGAKEVLEAEATTEAESSDDTVPSGGLSALMFAKETASPSEGTRACSGHIDLNIQMSVKGTEAENGLFSVEYPLPEGSEALWAGWNEETKGYVEELLNQDWLALYGINAADLLAAHPLSAADIEFYMEMLPEHSGSLRRSFVNYALASVGKVPYYWGGKPSGPGYEVNRFGTIVEPDQSGRFLKGLDCSGWINWVYWSVTGCSLGAESTSTLLGVGEEISREELMPGDICIRLGDSAHVVMFLAWADSGKMLCVQETSALTDNVELAYVDPDLPYYRRILPE